MISDVVARRLFFPDHPIRQFSPPHSPNVASTVICPVMPVMSTSPRPASAMRGFGTVDRGGANRFSVGHAEASVHGVLALPEHPVGPGDDGIGVPAEPGVIAREQE
jgi:hypothetical protein